MAPCIDALRQNIETFVGTLSSGDANKAAPVKDWRAKVVGYRDFEVAESEGLPWIVDNPFVRDPAVAQLALQAAGGGDEPGVAARHPVQDRDDAGDGQGARPSRAASGATAATRPGWSWYSLMRRSRKR